MVHLTVSGSGGRTRPRYVGRWRPNAAALCRGGGGRTRPRYAGRWRPNAAASCRAVAAARGHTMSGCPNGPRYITAVQLTAWYIECSYSLSDSHVSGSVD